MVTATGPISTNGTVSISSMAGDILVTALGPTGSITEAGDITLFAATGHNIIFASGGAFNQQSGSIMVNPANLIVDTTGTTAAKLNQSRYSTASQINVVAGQAGRATGKNITFNGDLVAGSSLVFLSSVGGAITGSSVVVNSLGVYSTNSGGNAGLTGSIGGNATRTAASQGQAYTSPNNNYRFNGCVIGSVSCSLIVFPGVIQPALITEFAVLVLRPVEEDVDVPLTNIFDEDRLCEELYQSAPDVARQVCQ